MSARVYVGRIPYRATERDLKKFFRDYGKIAEIIMKNGFAFVDFEEVPDAEEAVKDLNGKELMGVSLSIDIARGTPHGRDRYNYVPPPSSKSSSSRRAHRIIVENLSSKVTSRELKDLFRKVGDVLRAEANERHKNEGFVEFETSREVDKAFDKLDGEEVRGRKIRLVEEKRRNSPARSRSKTRSRSRSKRHEKSNSVDGDDDKEETNGVSEHDGKSRSASPAKNSDEELDD